MKKRFFVIFLILFISACTIPETKIYSLHLPDTLSPPAQRAQDRFSEQSIVILVNAPKYLSQTFIAYRNSPFQLDISKYAKWESSPSDMVREALKSSLSSAGIFKEVRASRAVPEGYYTLEINLKKFERFDEAVGSYAELLYDLQMYSPEMSDVYHTVISKKVNIEDKSFLSLAKGMSTIMNEGIKEVTEGIVLSLKK